MMRRLLTVAVLTVAWFADMSLGIGHAAIDAPAAAIWHTCQPRAIDYTGQYRVDNDIFAGRTGKSCIRSVTGHDLTITSNMPAQPGGVVSYPKIYVGQNFTSSDPQSGLPVPVTKAHRYQLNIASAGQPSPGSDYMLDMDVWLSPSKRTADQHGNAELVNAFRGRGAGGQLMSIGGHWYIVSHWITHMRNAYGNAVGAGWPLFLIRAVGTVRTRSIRPATFLWHLRRLGLVSSREWLDSVSLGVECWSGCKGLTYSMVTR